MSERPTGLCRIVVRGEIGPRFAEVFGPPTIERHGSVTTLVASFRDEAELEGMLSLLAGLGVEVGEVRCDRADARRAA